MSSTQHPPATTYDNGLPALKRVITDHSPSGQAIFSTAVPESLSWQHISNGDRFALSYATDSFPADLNAGADIAAYTHFTKNLPGISIPGGTVLRCVDIAPGVTSPMHRTVSLDYGVVLEGEVELVLDSGEVRLLRRGDVAVQRGTNHAWRNTSQESWARMLYVLQDAKPFVVGGRELGEDYGGIEGVRASKA